VEREFASGKTRALVATSTLAQGVNVSCRNVISVQLMLDPIGSANANRPAFVPLSVQRYRNQGGRAGRLCFGEPFGRSILIPGDDAELRRFTNDYVPAEPKPLEPAPCTGASFERICLDLVHTGRAADLDGLRSSMMQTFSGTFCNLGTHFSWLT